MKLQNTTRNHEAEWSARKDARDFHNPQRDVRNICKESIHGQVRRGLAGEAVFYARENRIEIGNQRLQGISIGRDPVSDHSVEKQAPEQYAKILPTAW